MVEHRHIVIVGVGRIGRLLIEALPEGWTLSVIDTQEEKLLLIPETHGNQTVRKVHGDATSRLVLDQVGLSPRSMVAVVTGDDAVNLEVGRVVREHFKTDELVILLDEISGLEEAGLCRGEVVTRRRGTAQYVFNHLMGTDTERAGFRMRQGDMRMFQILEGSAAIGRPLRELKPRRWLVAAVYREDELIVPHGETILQANDRVMLVGEAGVIESVGRFIHGSESVFPTQYGVRIGFVGTDKAPATAKWLLQKTKAEDLIEVDHNQIDPRIHTPEETSLALTQQRVGCLVMDSAPISLTSRLGFTRSARKKLLLAARVPILIARSTPPIKKILLAVSGEQNINAIAVVAIDLAHLVGAELSVLTVLPPSISASNETLQPLRKIPNRVAHIARFHGVTVECLLDEGNPIERIRHHASSYDLLVVGHSRHRRNTVFSPDVSLHLLHKTPCSVMFVPWNPAGQ